MCSVSVCSVLCTIIAETEYGAQAQASGTLSTVACTYTSDAMIRILRVVFDWTTNGDRTFTFNTQNIRQNGCYAIAEHHRHPARTNVYYQLPLVAFWMCGGCRVVRCIYALSLDALCVCSPSFGCAAVAQNRNDSGLLFSYLFPENQKKRREEIEWTN